MIDDFEACYRVLQARDSRFDGWFVTAVTSTRIYCRPSCPAMTPKREHLRFYATAAAAQKAGFRACKRCRPEASPGSPEWDRRGDLVARAMRLIADGVVDRDGVEGLAARLHYSRRQLERALVAELGAGPLAIARAQRARTARTLIETSDLRFADVAFAAGFASVRQFNDTVREVFALTPRELRNRARRTGPSEPGVLSLRLAFRPPFDPVGVFAHLVGTAVPGVERWDGAAYHRTLSLPHGTATVALRPEADHIGCELRLDDLRDLSTAVARVRFLLDLDADPVAVDRHLGEDPALAPLVRTTPGRRVPRTVDGAELAMRAVIGQQVSTAAAATHAARLAREIGDPLANPAAGLTHTFPSAASVAKLSPGDLRMPATRARTLIALATAIAEGRLDVSPGADRDAARRALHDLPGIGPWTAGVITMRGLGDPDAFLAADLGVQKAAAALGLPEGARRLEARSEAWRPWRAYAVQHLWGHLPHAVSRLPVASTDERSPA